jgi:hypothetical protein
MMVKGEEAEADSSMVMVVGNEASSLTEETVSSEVRGTASSMTGAATAAG